jgi:F-type H+-transporting ATPase subunit epsilon
MGDQSTKLSCAVITPDRQVLDVTVDSVVMPAHDGLIGILQGRAPLLCKLGIGIVKLVTGDQERRLFIDGGFAQVRDNKVTILTSAALEPEQIERSAAEAALKAAQELAITDEESVAARADAIARAKSQLALVS